VFDLEHALAQNDIDGKSVSGELSRMGYAGSSPVGKPIHSYFEAHIEQGPVLEDKQKTVGVVTGALGLRWYDVVVTGQDAHAGPTPMHLRKDALLAAAKVIQSVNQIAHAHQPYGRGTVGYLQVKPNSRNVVPGEVRLSVDLRHADKAALDEMDAGLRTACDEAGRTCGVDITVKCVTDYAPLAFDTQLVAEVRSAASKLGYSHMDIVSGAGHDACYISRVAPTAMIFVPCENGISHNEIENARKEDLEAGCNVLLHAVLSKAK
jgi:N-carbamoyl-L-amino-acid hydrolase